MPRRGGDDFLPFSISKEQADVGSQGSCRFCNTPTSHRRFFFCVRPGTNWDPNSQWPSPRDLDLHMVGFVFLLASPPPQKKQPRSIPCSQKRGANPSSIPNPNNNRYPTQRRGTRGTSATKPSPRTESREVKICDLGSAMELTEAERPGLGFGGWVSGRRFQVFFLHLFVFLSFFLLPLIFFRGTLAAEGRKQIKT